MKLPPDVTCGTIEVAIDSSYRSPDGMICDGDRWFEMMEDGYKLGALTLWEQSEGGVTVHHGSTGVLIASCSDLETGFALARAADKAIDWSTVRRNGDLIGFPLGWTAEKAAAVLRAIEPFAKLPQEGPPSGATFFNPPVDEARN